MSFFVSHCQSIFFGKGGIVITLIFLEEIRWDMKQFMPMALSWENDISKTLSPNHPPFFQKPLIFHNLSVNNLNPL